MVVSADAEWGGDLLVGLLGPLTATRRGKPITIRGPKRRALLAMLVLRPGRVVAAERLVEDLWDGRPPGQARATLQSHISHLRRDLGGEQDAIVAGATGYRLDAGHLDVDIGQFERALDRAVAQPTPRAVSEGLSRALTLWRGPALAELATAAWTAPEIARLEARRDTAVEARVEADLALGRHAAVLADLQQLVEAEPLREHRWLLLLAALQDAGRHVEAVRAAYRYRMLLVEAGLSPSPAFAEAEGAVLRHEPVELRLPTTHPVRPGRARAALAAPPEGPGSRRLPLVGRRAEQAALAAASHGHPGLVLVSGEPGIGKSHLVSELAERARRAGATVLVGHCDDGLAVPYQPFVEALQALVGRWPSEPAALEGVLGEHPEHLAQLVPDVVRLLPHREQVAGREPDIER